MLAFASDEADQSRAGEELKKKCQDQSLCIRISLAGLDFLNLVKDFTISTESHDSSIAESPIRDSYPGRECRLDTIILGPRCPEKFPLSLDLRSESKSACVVKIGSRPRCWYNPDLFP